MNELNNNQNVSVNPIAPPSYTPKPPIVPDKITKTDTIMIFVFLVVAFLMSAFTLFGGFKLGYTITNFAILISSIIYIKKSISEAKFTLFTRICTVLSLTASIIPSIYNDYEVKIAVVILNIALYGVVCSSLSKTKATSSTQIDIISDIITSAFCRPFHFVSGNSFLQAFSSNAKSENKNIGKTLVQVLIGLIIAVPLLLFVVPMLTKADTAFKSVITAIFFDTSIIAKIILTVLIFPFIYSVIYSFVKQKSVNGLKTNQNSNNFFPIVITATTLTSLSFFYVCYIFSQFVYFVSAFSGILPEGYENTPANYARQGFFEMSTIVVINIIIVGIAYIFTKKNDEKVSPAIKILCTFILGFSLFLIATAFSKMALYINMHGFTRRRILTSVFMVMLVIVIASIIIRLYIKKFQHIKVIIVGCSIIGILVGFCDIDRSIAWYNTTAYRNGKLDEINTELLCELDNSAVPYLLDVLETVDEVSDIRELKFNLERRYKRLDEKSTGISDFNYSDYKAYNILKENIDKFIGKKSSTKISFK